MLDIVISNCGAIVELRWPDCGSTGPPSTLSTTSVIRLCYKLDRIARDHEPVSERSLRTKLTADRLEFVIYIWTNPNVPNSESDEFIGHPGRGGFDSSHPDIKVTALGRRAIHKPFAPLDGGDPRKCFEAVRRVRPERANLTVCL